VGKCQLRVACPALDGWTSGNFKDRVASIDHVIFTPSYGRASTALLNRGTLDPSKDVTIVVVRPDEFEGYVKQWARDCIIVALDSTVDSIGTTRQRILDIAISLDRDSFWMVDDSIIPTSLKITVQHDSSIEPTSFVKYLDGLRHSALKEGLAVLSAASRHSSDRWHSAGCTTNAVQTNTRTPTAILYFSSVGRIREKGVTYIDVPNKEDVLFAVGCMKAALSIGVDREFSYEVLPLPGGTALDDRVP
jgi:hypothetical protein